MIIKQLPAELSLAIKGFDTIEIYLVLSISYIVSFNQGGNPPSFGKFGKFRDTHHINIFFFNCFIAVHSQPVASHYYVKCLNNSSGLLL